MRKTIVSFIFICVLAFSASAQNKEARQIDEFGVVPCGEMLGRMQLIFIESQNEPNSQIYVVYYGARFRKEELRNKKTNQVDRVQLKYPHREDALNRAKAIPLFLTTVESYPLSVRNAFKDKIVLIDGGYQQNIKMEVWLVPKDAAPPKPSPTIDEKDVKFRTDKPFGTPDWKRCYDAY
jgi:hypothetical protein